MRNGTTLNISFANNLARFIKEQVKSGCYASASEVVREAVRRMADNANGRDRSPAVARFDRAKVRAAIAGLKRLQATTGLGRGVTIRELIDEGCR